MFKKHARDSLEHNSRAFTSREIDLHVFQCTTVLQSVSQGIIQQEKEIRIFWPNAKALKRNHEIFNRARNT